MIWVRPATRFADVATVAGPKRAAHRLLSGAVEFARDRGAPVIEGYPVDNKGQQVDLRMAHVGARRLFEAAGFTKVADTDSVSNGSPPVFLRLVRG
ncbi:MAG: hypothetical protein ACR2LI_04995 [Propionibacteriaceae bacterium]